MTSPAPIRRLEIRSVGVLGAGRVGKALAALARDVGLDVVTADSSDAKGLADASGGNHGAAVAHAAQRLGHEAHI